tara:strand:+ start:1742 stop:2644 length:903 start_codon:yes stop_codon:yes gene_type:complete
MNVLLDNVNLLSNSGPNSFARKLANTLSEKNNIFIEQPSDCKIDVQLSFIQATQFLAPIVQRLDGIYFNSEQEWKKQNEPIRKTHELASGVIYQSKFNQALTEKFFEKKEKSIVIGNGTDLEAIKSIPPSDHPALDLFEKVWMCASSWRPHKRLAENIRYFLEHSTHRDCLIVSGNGFQSKVKHDRIFYTGGIDWSQLVSLYKRSDTFIHLALLDHCPNVVVDARASGCKIVCTDSGGTKEIAGPEATVIKDMDWDFEPFKLYDPPSLNFSEKRKNKIESTIDIVEVAKKYEHFLSEIKR